MESTGLEMIEVRYRKIEGPIDPTFTQTWEKELTEHAKKLLRQDGCLRPVVFFVSDDKDDPTGLVEGFIDLAQFFTNDEGKELAANLMPMIFDKLGAFALCQMFEAWTLKEKSKIDQYRDAGYKDMSQIEGRAEILGVSLQTRTGTSLRAYELIRDDEGNVVDFITTITEEDPKSEGKMTGGRMVDWIKDSERKAN